MHYINMKLLHLFMGTIVITGLILVITAFYAYSKLSGECTSSTLRGKLQAAIGLGTAFMTIGIGYIVCVSKGGDRCNFGDSVDWKTYMLLFLLLAIGATVLGLTLSIQSEVNKGECNVDLGSLPSILITIGSIQIAIPILYAIYVFIKKWKGKKTPQVVPVEKTSSRKERLEIDIKTLQATKKARRSLEIQASKKDGQIAEIDAKIADAQEKDDEDLSDRLSAQKVALLGEKDNITSQLNNNTTQTDRIESSIKASSRGGSSNSSSGGAGRDGGGGGFFRI
jgi:uncharacterized membrane protein YgcG